MKTRRYGALNILIMLTTSVCQEFCKIPTNSSECIKIKETFHSSEYQGISSGSCEFKCNFCSYNQTCTGTDSQPWKISNGYAVMKGKSGNFDSFSVLGSPMIYISCDSYLIINATIANPSQLEIALIKNNKSCILKNRTTVAQVEKITEQLLVKGPAYIEILFRGLNGGSDSAFVRLHSVQLTNTENCTNPSYQTGSKEQIECRTATESESESNSVNVGAIVGPIMAGLAIITIVLVVWAWKKRRHSCDGMTHNKDDLKTNVHQKPSWPSPVTELNSDDRQFDIKNEESTTMDDTMTTNISSQGNKLLYTPYQFEQQDTHSYDRIPEGGIAGKSRQESDHYDLIKSHADTNAFRMQSLNGRNPASNLNRVKLTEQQNAPPLYSQVQKGGPKPGITKETIDDYNRIVLENKASGKESRDTTSDMYNKLNSPVNNAPPNFLNKPLKPDMDMPQDDYNKLDYKPTQCDTLADNGNEYRDDCDPKLNAYSSVGNLTDTYNRVHSDKNDKVIASDYDHIG